MKLVIHTNTSTEYTRICISMQIRRYTRTTTLEMGWGGGGERARGGGGGGGAPRTVLREGESEREVMGEGVRACEREIMCARERGTQVQRRHRHGQTHTHRYKTQINNT